MKIAETDIRIFRAKQLTVEFQPPPTVVDVEMFEGALTPSENDTDTPLSSVKVEVYFRGESRDEIRRNVSRLCALLQKGTPLTLDGYRDRFMGYMTSNTTNKTITGKRYRAEFEFSGYWFSDEVELNFNETSEFSFDAEGTRDAPCIISMTALSFVEELKITGFSDEIIITNINRGETVVIDGEQGTVMVDGKNKFLDVTLWEFPFLTVGEKKTHKIVVSSDRMMVSIRYRPMWL